MSVSGPATAQTIGIVKSNGSTGTATQPVNDSSTIISWSVVGGALFCPDLIAAVESQLAAALLPVNHPWISWRQQLFARHRGHYESRNPLPSKRERSRFGQTTGVAGCRRTTSMAAIYFYSAAWHTRASSREWGQPSGVAGNAPSWSGRMGGLAILHPPNRLAESKCFYFFACSST